jgi:hypothetical protein
MNNKRKMEKKKKKNVEITPFLLKEITSRINGVHL